MGRARELALAGVGLAIVFAGVAAAGAAAAAAPSGHQWARFGVDAARSNALPTGSGFSVASLAHLRRQQVALPGTADSSAVYVSGVTVGTAKHDVFVVTTTYGRTLAIDAGYGRTLWTFTPPGYAGWPAARRSRPPRPVADPDRRWSTPLAGRQVHKLRLATAASAGWPVSVTQDPTHEKIASALNFARAHVLATTGGYIGDAPPYQGHVAIDPPPGRLAASGTRSAPTAASCIVPSHVPRERLGDLGTRRAVVDARQREPPRRHGQRPWDGQQYWGDSVLELCPKPRRARQLHADEHRRS